MICKSYSLQLTRRNICRLIINFELNINPMITGFCKKTKRVLRACDLFYTTELARYKEDPEFKSMSGGFCSIIVIIAFLVVFTQTIANTFQKQQISSSTTLAEEIEPTQFTTADNVLMFAIGIPRFNLNDNLTKYFNVQITQKQVINGSKVSTNLILEPCKRQIWSQVNQTYGTMFDKLGMSQWLCLSPNTIMYFQGKYSSNIFKYVKISVSACSAISGDSRTCVNQSFISTQIAAAGGSLSLNYYYINTIINAGDSKYLGYYFEDKNYFQFSQDFGTTANMYISNYQIQTDQSLWPLTSYQYDVGGIIYEQTTQFVFKPTSLYLELYLRKSTLSLSISRSFLKYFDTLSYIGGLFTTIMAALVLFHKYNEYSYEVQIASKIYRYDKNQKIQTQSFNILKFMSYLLFLVLDFFGKAPDWQPIKHFDNVREEIGKQMDLTFILKKLAFLENCMQFLFRDCQLKCLYLKGKTTLHDAVEIRKKLSTRSKLLRLKKKFKDDQSFKSEIDEQNQKNQIQMDKNFELDEIKNKKDHNWLNQTTNQKQLRQSNDLIQAQLRQRSEIDITSQKLIIQEDSEEDGSEGEEEKERQFYLKLTQSIEKLHTMAMEGDQRCQRILNSLDRHILDLIPKNKKKELNMSTSCMINYENDTKIKMVQVVPHDFEYLDDNHNN